MKNILFYLLSNNHGGDTTTTTTILPTKTRSSRYSHHSWHIILYNTLFCRIYCIAAQKILPEDTDKVKHQENYYPAKIQQQQQLPLLSVAERDGWEIKSHTSNTNDDDDDDNVDRIIDSDNDDNNTTTTVNNDRYANMDLQLQISKGSISNAFTPHEINQAILQRNQLQQQQPSSPACYPHFNLYQPNGTWNNTTKFKRILFYHARKAGGSSMYKCRPFRYFDPRLKRRNSHCSTPRHIEGKI